MDARLQAEYQTKEGGLSRLLLAAAPMLSMAAMHSDQAHTQELLAQAEAMNAAAREVEAQRMAPTIDALKTAEVADAVARDIVQGMDKEAFGPLLAMLGRVGAMGLRGGGRLLSAAGRSLPTSGTQRLVQATGGARAGTTGLGGVLRRSGASMQRTGGQLGAAGQRMANLPSKPLGPLPGPRGVPSVGGKPPPPPSIAARATPAPAVRAPAPAGTPAKGSVAGTLAPPPTAAPAAKPAKSKPLIGTGTKLKMLGGAGLLGAGYVGMKGLEATRDYMMMPSGSFGHTYGAPLQHNVSEYGYPMY